MSLTLEEISPNETNDAEEGRGRNNDHTKEKMRNAREQSSLKLLMERRAKSNEFAIFYLYSKLLVLKPILQKNGLHHLCLFL